VSAGFDVRGQLLAAEGWICPGAACLPVEAVTMGLGTFPPYLGRVVSGEQVTTITDVLVTTETEMTDVTVS
jgi:hypothetical protein